MLHFGADLVHKIGLAMNVKDHFCLAVAFGKAALDAFYSRKKQKLQRHLLSSFRKINNKNAFKPGQIFFTISKEFDKLDTNVYESIVHWFVIKRITCGRSIIVNFIESEYTECCIKVGTIKNKHGVNTRISKPIQPFKMIGPEYTARPSLQKPNIEYLEPLIDRLEYCNGQQPPPIANSLYSWRPYILHLFVDETLDRGPTVIADYGLYGWLSLNMRIKMANLVKEIYNINLAKDWQNHVDQKKELLETIILTESDIVV